MRQQRAIHHREYFLSKQLLLKINQHQLLIVTVTLISNQGSRSADPLLKIEALVSSHKESTPHTPQCHSLSGIFYGYSKRTEKIVAFMETLGLLRPFCDQGSSKTVIPVNVMTRDRSLAV